ncbi:multicopper oxidase domain-containing protein [Actinocorallia libanotica]|uniref:Copper-containing nitrite reductase n=1 Tax=Actinocorallia libanotica TaxID=46162 RepID=A0ABP4AKY6_9ACTN
MKKRPEPPSSAPAPRALWHARANAVVLAWLALALAALAVRGVLDVPRWLIVHLFLLGAVTNAIVTWTEHFATALLRLPPAGPRWTVVRPAALNIGIAAVLGGSLSGSPWPATGGAALVAGTVAAHVGLLAARSRRSLAGRFAHVLGWYVCSGAALVVGGTLGGVMVSGLAPASWHERVEAAHVHTNLLGWVGLAVVGTLFTLWPTVLRTRMVEDVGTVARRALCLAVPGLAAVVGGLLADAGPVAAAGLALFTGAVLFALVPFVRTARRRRPHNPAAWMLAAGTCWFVVVLLADLLVVATRPPDEVAAGFAALLPLILAGFAAQILVGSLTFLLPVVLGGGPAGLKQSAALLERGWIVRLVLVNAAVPCTLLPWARASSLAWAAVAVAYGGFVVLAALAVGRRLQPSPPALGIGLGGVLTALAVVFAVSGPAGPAVRTVAGGGVQTVQVTLAGMRVSPGTIEAPRGTRLVLEVTNEDAQPHDLRLATGEQTPLLSAGGTATLTLDPLTGPVEGWCTVAGHRAAGMTLRIEVTGASAAATRADHSEHSDGAALDLAAAPGPSWKPYDAALRPAPGGTEHEVELHATEEEFEVAPGVEQEMWTFGGGVPGPVLRGKVGDVFTVTFVNDGAMGHGIDFHAGSLAPDVPMRTIQPGERLTYRFKAEHAGAWLYHCSTMPMLQHIANGMYGAVVIDPPGLPAVDREYLLVQGELYLGTVDDRAAGMREGKADAWMFNGTAAGYDHAPLAAKAGERVRIWVVAAGPGSGTAFHIVGARFDTVYKEGAYLLERGGPGGAQVLDLSVAQGGFAETVFPEPGRYPFVDHDMRHGEAGAHGFFEVTR